MASIPKAEIVRTFICTSEDEKQLHCCVPYMNISVLQAAVKFSFIHDHRKGKPSTGTLKFPYPDCPTLLLTQWAGHQDTLNVIRIQLQNVTTC